MRRTFGRISKRTSRSDHAPPCWLPIAVAVLTASCGGSQSSPPTAPTPTVSLLLVSVSVRPPHLMPGEAGDGSAFGWTSQNGSPIYGPVPVTTWTTSNSSVARIDTAGRVTGIAAGTARITATVPGASASDVVTVFTENDLAALQVTCTTPMAVRQFGECKAEARLRSGGTVQVQASWASSRPEVAEVSSGGRPTSTVLVVSQSAGQTTVTASFRGLEATATVVVSS